MKKSIVITLVVILVVVGLIGFAAWYVFTGYLNGDGNRPKMDIRNLEAAVLTFQVRHKMLPADLQALTKRSDDGNAPLLQQEALLDPWRQPYHYDPKQLDPKTGVPLIWSDGPPDRPQKIANWDPPSK